MRHALPCMFPLHIGPQSQEKHSVLYVTVPSPTQIEPVRPNWLYCSRLSIDSGSWATVSLLNDYKAPLHQIFLLLIKYRYIFSCGGYPKSWSILCYSHLIRWRVKGVGEDYIQFILDLWTKLFYLDKQFWSHRDAACWLFYSTFGGLTWFFENIFSALQSHSRLLPASSLAANHCQLDGYILGKEERKEWEREESPKKNLKKLNPVSLSHHWRISFFFFSLARLFFIVRNLLYGGC